MVIIVDSDGIQEFLVGLMGTVNTKRIPIVTYGYFMSLAHGTGLTGMGSGSGILSASGFDIVPPSHPPHNYCDQRDRSVSKHGLGNNGNNDLLPGKLSCPLSKRGISYFALAAL